MLFNIIIILVTLLVASFYDIKQKTVPGVVLYPLLVIGLFLNMLFMASSSGFMAYANFIITCLVLVALFVVHYKKLIGGADVLLIVGILLATPKEFMTWEFYLFFGLFTCVCGLAYYFILLLTGFKPDVNIKFVPAILIGYVVTIYGLFFNEIMVALAGFL